MGKVRTDGQAGRLEVLLAAAAGVFAQQGYHAATIAEVAKRARVATGTFYLYFPSKEQCFAQLIARLYDKVLREVRAQRRGAESVLVKLDRSVQAVLQCFRQEHDLAAIVLLQASGATKELQERLAVIEAELVQLLAQDLAEAARDGLIPPGDATLRAHLVLGAMREALVYGLRHDGEPDEEDDEVRRFLLWAVGGQAAAVEEQRRATS